MFRPYLTFRSKDFWLSAYLHLMGAKLLQTTVDGGRCIFTFDNAEDVAYRLFTDYRAANGHDRVSVTAYRDAYRFMQDESRKAKVASYDDNNNDHN